MEEFRLKYCSVNSSYLFSGQSYWTEKITIYNDKVGRLRLLKLTPSMYLYEVSTGVVKNVGVNVEIRYVDSPPYNDVNEYKERIVSVSGAGVSYPLMSYVYPYDQRDWVFPVIMDPGSKFEFWFTISPSQVLSGVYCYLYCVFVFEDA